MAELDAEGMEAAIEELQRTVERLQIDVCRLKMLSQGWQQSYGSFAKEQFAMFKALENDHG